jgi:hypothetical protein
MKTGGNIVPKIVLLSAMLIAFDLLGCRGVVTDKALIRYQYVTIPGYGMADYEHF